MRITTPRRTGIATLALITSLSLAACGGDESVSAGDGVLVIATTSVLGDIASEVIGAAGTVEVLVPLGADPHMYQPSSREAADLRRADLVISIGFDLEEGLGDILDAAASDGVTVLEIAPLVDPLPRSDGTIDPHVWLDPIRMAQAATHIASSLDLITPGSWQDRAETYARALHGVDDEIRTLLADLPPERRKLITNHDALGYFADRYDLEIVGVVIPGGTTLATPSSSDIAAIVGLLDELQVPAIFAETTEPSQVAATISMELDSAVAVVELYTGSLGPADTEAATLIGMLRLNARRIAQALA